MKKLISETWRLTRILDDEKNPVIIMNLIIVIIMINIIVITITTIIINIINK